ncbi:MAG: adenylate kinase [Candidatus Omnitrophica bacterium]|nr:adenylate kinase [Candidatus Omnitrophota bacterium]
MRIVLLGPPGAGKGSLARVIKDMMGIAHISTGDMLREEMKKGSPLGLEIKGLIAQGFLVSDEIVTRLVEQRLQNSRDSKGFMLDGFPRTVAQAKDLDNILAEIGKPLDFALNMEADVDVILMRLTGRRVCRKCGALYHVRNKPPKAAGVCDLCGGELHQRCDDNEETIRKRMDVYMANTRPILAYYEQTGRLKKVDGNKGTPDLSDDLVKISNEDKKPYQDQNSGRS